VIPLFPTFALGAIALVAVGSSLHQRKKRRAVRDRLRADWGHPKNVARDLPLVASYHQAVSADGAGAVGDRTWQDLDLDAVFRFLDRTESSVGCQSLYHRLRSTAHSPQDLAAFDEIVEALRYDEETRLDVQIAVRALAGNSTFWLWSLVLEPIEPLPRWAVIYPLFAMAMALLIVLTAVLRGPFLLLAVVGLVGGAALRARFGRRLVPLMEPFADMVRLLAVAKRLGRLDRLPAGMRARLAERLPALARLRRSAGWLGRAQTASLDLGGLAIEYLNLLFCLDANAAMIGARELRAHQADVHRVLLAVGELDAALSVASMRDGNDAWTRPVFAPDDEPVVFTDVRHPLLRNAVANSVTLGPPAGLLVTGANMTGKSTFLRTVGVNVVLAQTINTVFASAYHAPWLSVESCISPTDDLQAGKSYYQAEVETLVAMLAATGSPGSRLYLFDELFRGTNTLDRIGAASAVLGYLVRRAAPGRGTSDVAQGSSRAADVAQGFSPVSANRCLVIAATHDLELVSLLPDYAVVHFADQLTDAGLHFDYVLRPGPTTTRNAIALLGVLGAPKEVVADALARTDRLRAAADPESKQD
jgi:hypothetical protein